MNEGTTMTKRQRMHSISGEEYGRLTDTLALLRVCEAAAMDMAARIGSTDVPEMSAALSKMVGRAVDELAAIYESLDRSERSAGPVYTPGPDRPPGYRAPS